MRGDLREILELKLTDFGNGIKLEEGIGNKWKRGTKEIVSISVLGICCN